MTTPRRRLGARRRCAFELAYFKASHNPKVAGWNPAPAMGAAMAPDPEMALRFAWNHI
jgi:hypothetical protein